MYVPGRQVTTYILGNDGLYRIEGDKSGRVYPPKYLKTLLSGKTYVEVEKETSQQKEREIEALKEQLAIMEAEKKALEDREKPPSKVVQSDNDDSGEVEKVEAKAKVPSVPKKPSRPRSRAKNS